jgi:hypothetical protein
MLISNSLMPSIKNAPKKLKAENQEKMHQGKNYQNPPASFFGYSFFRGICLCRHQTI